MKRAFCVLVMVLAIVSLVMAGCGGSEDEEDTPTATAPPGKTVTPEATATKLPEQTPTATDTPMETPGPTATEPSDDTLSDIFSGISGFKSVKYDMVLEGPGITPVTSTVWLKPGKGMKTETNIQGMTQIMLVNYDTQTAYTYLPAQNMAIKLPFSDVPESAIEGAQAIEDYQPDIVGSETIDGKSSYVVEWDFEGTSGKMWIWKDNGFPIRVEAKSPEGTVTIEYTNIEFSSISDSEFELPEGVQVQELPF